MAPRLTEMDDHVSFLTQLAHDDGPIVLINTFHVAESDVPTLLQAWADDAAWMKQQPGYISTQLHRGTAGSTHELSGVGRQRVLQTAEGVLRGKPGRRQDDDDVHRDREDESAKGGEKKT